MAITHDHTQIPAFSTFMDPSDTPNFSVAWGAFLGSSEITNSQWTINPTLTTVGSFVSTSPAQTTTIIVSGMAADTTYEIANNITTNDATPLTFERSFKFTTKNL